MKKRFTVFCLAFVCVLLAVLMGIPAWAGEYAPGEALVVFRAPEGVKVTAASLASDGDISVSVAAAAASVGAEVEDTFEAISEADGNIFVRVRSATKSTEELIAELKQRPGVIAASPNWMTHSPERAPAPQNVSDTPLVGLSEAGASRTPNDKHFHYLWNMKKIRAPEVWATATGSRDIYVAVVDTGVSLHPDLKDNIAADLGLNTATVSGDHDRTFSQWDMDYAAHGTHVAGTIGAVGDNGIGVAGVNWSVSLIPIRVFDDVSEPETVSKEMRALNYLISLLQKDPDMKLASVNLSLGGFLPMTPEQMQQDVYWMAYRALDRTNRTLIVVAAGNSSCRTGEPAPFDEPLTADQRETGRKPTFYKGDYLYPAAFTGLDNFIVVGGTESDDTALYSTNWGERVDIAAPGGEILSTYVSFENPSNPEYMCMFLNGTSMAAPHVSGAAALLLSACPDATPAQIKKALLDGANPSINPVVYPYESRCALYAEWADAMILSGDMKPASRDAYLEDIRNTFAPYRALDGVGTVSRTGLLDVKKSLDLLTAEMSASKRSSGSGGCSAGFGALAAAAVLFGAASFVRKRR